MRSQMERIEDVFNYEPDVAAVDKLEPNLHLQETERLRGEITVKNIVFGYNRLAQPLIRFSPVKAGGSVALWAHQAAAMTLAKLLSGLYQPWSGEIL